MIKLITAAVIVLVALTPRQGHAAGPNPLNTSLRVEAEAWSEKQGYQYSIPSNDPEGGGDKVVGLATGNWMKYNVNSMQPGSYTVSFRVATTQSNAEFTLKSGNTTLAVVPINSTGGWDIWKTYSFSNITLAADQTIQVILTGTENCDFNWMEFKIGSTSNQPPTANAGLNQTIVLPVSTVSLTGSGNDQDGTIASYAWTQISGAAATIGTPSQASTTVTGLSTAGHSIFRLTVTDNDGGMGTSSVDITVNPDPRPAVNAGQDQFLSLPITLPVTLSGSATPNNSATIASYAWSQVGGNGTGVTIDNASAASTTINGLTSTGDRVFRLTVTDNQGNTGTDEMTINVQAGGSTGNFWTAGSGNSIYYNVTGGNVGIGTMNPLAKLAVNGDINAKKLKITQLAWSDYVFEKKYRLPTLAEVEKYIQLNKHLPDIISAAEVEKNGLDVGDNQSQLLRKIEELTLYAIDANKNAIAANKKMEQQQQTINALQEVIRKIQLQLKRGK